MALNGHESIDAKTGKPFFKHKPGCTSQKPDLCPELGCITEEKDLEQRLYERLNKAQKLQHDVRDLILREDPSMDYFKARDLANKIILLCTK